MLEPHTVRPALAPEVELTFTEITPLVFQWCHDATAYGTGRRHGDLVAEAHALLAASALEMGYLRDRLAKTAARPDIAPPAELAAAMRTIEQLNTRIAGLNDHVTQLKAENIRLRARRST